MQKWAPLEFGLLTALAIWLAVARGPAWWWIFAALFVAMGALALVVLPRQLAKVRRLRRELERSG